MNKTKVRNFQIFSTIFAFVLGTLLHFTFNLSNQNNLVAIFSAINESVWEHLKLIYFPMVITTIIGFFHFKKSNSFICSKTLGILVAMFFTFTFFYTYKGIIGRNFAIVDISSFFIAIILGEYITYILIQKNFICNTKIAFLILLLLLICFIFFTFRPPTIGLFQDPITRQYGIVTKYIK